MEMPKPTPGHRALEALAGEWSGDDTMHPSPWDPQGGVAQATLVARVAVDGFYVLADYEQRRGGVVTYRGHGVYGFDPKTSEVVLHWFDSLGAGGDSFRGKLVDQVLTLSAKNAMGQQRLTYDLRERGTLRSRMEMSQDGKAWKAMFDGVYRKKG